MRFSASAILDWLRAGYPRGVPQQDYIALLGVLQRHLTDDEVVHVARALLAQTDGRDVDEDLIRARIHEHVKGAPTDEDVRRVAAHLAAGGWPLAGPHAGDSEPGVD